MAPMSSNKSNLELSTADRQTLLALASASIESGLRDERFVIEPSEYSSDLQKPGASFVTIKVIDQLRGCIGSLEAKRGLALDVVNNAYAAAFGDPRFAALTVKEFADLHIHISVLSSPESLVCTSEADLIQQLRPGLDGVILQEGSCRATYLPSVWESLSDPAEFVRQLKRKAGLPPDHWSERMQIKRYTIESIP